MHMMARGHQYTIPGFPLQKWEIRHFEPNLACLHLQLQSRFCFVAMVQLNVRADTHGQRYKNQCKAIRGQKGVIPGFPLYKQNDGSRGWFLSAGPHNRPTRLSTKPPHTHPNVRSCSDHHTCTHGSFTDRSISDPGVVTLAEHPVVAAFEKLVNHPSFLAESPYVGIVL